MGLRQATSADLPALAALELAAFGDPWTVGQLRGQLELPRSLTLLAEMAPPAESSAAPGTVGYATFLLVADEAELLRIAVHPEARKRGHARRLLATGLELLATIGVTQCHLEVREDNLAAIELYERAGFARLGRRDGYYKDGSAALLYRRESVRR